MFNQQNIRSKIAHKENIKLPAKHCQVFFFCRTVSEVCRFLETDINAVNVLIKLDFKKQMKLIT